MSFFTTIIDAHFAKRLSYLNPNLKPLACARADGAQVCAGVPDRAGEGVVGNKPSNTKRSIHRTLTPTLSRLRERVQHAASQAAST